MINEDGMLTANETSRLCEEINSITTAERKKKRRCAVLPDDLTKDEKELIKLCGINNLRKGIEREMKRRLLKKLIKPEDVNETIKRNTRKD